MSIEVEFRNTHGQAASIGSAGPYTYDVEVEGEASHEQLEDLVAHVDAIAEIPNSIRRDTAVKLRHVEIGPS